MTFTIDHEARATGTVWKGDYGRECRRNMHRNIFFKDTKQVTERPFSFLDSQHPEDLWNWMDAQRQTGNELLAIAHK